MGLQNHKPKYTVELPYDANLDYGTPYIHPCTLDFPTKRDKQDDDPEFHGKTFSQFWVAKKNGASVAIAEFSCPTPRLHHWAAALIKSGDTPGKHLIIWDRNPENTNPRVPGDCLSYAQQKFWEQARNRGPVTLWYNTTRYYFTRGPRSDPQIVEPTGDWIRTLQNFGNRPILGDDDPRLKGCTKFI
ncbi:hypothetical protein N7492_009729 [Penicillium capsulatum]|uniref:Uncharacterized protein n=1 Tax=Penicillium capsulatum TaxID=69766 RepID=A0A9W9HPB9_9EURO|nr:hypothetical protein N7492_009729 [Penicillium capsulatum]KAJ6114189.1 hypothetical protein N7512_007634 [Penicillium capsulatum]